MESSRIGIPWTTIPAAGPASNALTAMWRFCELAFSSKLFSLLMRCRNMIIEVYKKKMFFEICARFMLGVVSFFVEIKMIVCKSCFLPIIRFGCASCALSS
jgi:hypothetical protein